MKLLTFLLSALRVQHGLQFCTPDVAGHGLESVEFWLLQCFFKKLAKKKIYLDVKKFRCKKVTEFEFLHSVVGGGGALRVYQRVAILSIKYGCSNPFGFRDKAFLFNKLRFKKTNKGASSPPYGGVLSRYTMGLIFKIVF